MAALLAVFAGVVYYGADRVIYKSAALRVEAAASQLDALARAGGNGPFGPVGAVTLLSDESQLDALSGPGLYIQAYNSQGARIGASSNLAGNDLPLAGYRPWNPPEGVEGNWGIAQTPVGTVLAHWHTIHEGPVIVATIVVAESLDAVRQTLGAFLTLLIVSYLAAIGLIIAATVWLSRTAIGPINQIARSAQEIGGEDMTKRLNWQGRTDELGVLAARFDEMLARLEAAFARERRFISDASHELKTPLTVINGNAQMLLRWGAQDEVVRREALEAIRGESASMARVINAMLTLAKTENLDALTLEPTNLRPIVLDAATALRPQAEAKGLSLRAECDGDAYVMGEPGLLRQLVTNLTENAIKFTSSGGVQVRMHSENSDARLDVTDTGPGIAADALPQVFERFYRADPARSRAVEGTGLGLAVARNIARAHGGDIDVASEIGKGTTFSVRLPAIPLTEPS
jgi:signal transduction histidine kinase